MSATQQRDRASKLAKRDPQQARKLAQQVRDPWFRAQALAWVLRYTDKDPIAVAQAVSKAANECEDAYKRVAVRAWMIAALAERGLAAQATQELQATLVHSTAVTPSSSRSEALTLLLHAALTMSHDDGVTVNEVLQATCGEDSHWRCRRAVRDGQRLLTGELQPRLFFW